MFLPRLALTSTLAGTSLAGPLSPSHPLFSGASRTALHDLPAAAATEAISISDGVFGAAHAASAEREFETLLSTSAFTPTVDKTFVNVAIKPRDAATAASTAAAGSAERGDLTIHLDALAFDRHPALRMMPSLRRVVGFMELLRARLRMRRVALMLTCYPGGGARFTNHFDSYDWEPRGRSRFARWTAIYYPNLDYDSADGGLLRLHPREADAAAIDVAPVADRVVLFNASRVPHEVTSAARRRFALTAWFFECDAFPTDAAAEPASESDGGLLCAMPNGYGVDEDTPRADQLANAARRAAGGEETDSGARFLHNQCEFLVCDPRAKAGSTVPNCTAACVDAVQTLRQLGGITP
jgi:hypothetical protein